MKLITKYRYTCPKCGNHTKDIQVFWKTAWYSCDNCGYTTIGTIRVSDTPDDIKDGEEVIGYAREKA